MATKELENQCVCVRASYKFDNINCWIYPTINVESNIRDILMSLSMRRPKVTVIIGVFATAKKWVVRNQYQVVRLNTKKPYQIFLSSFKDAML